MAENKNQDGRHHSDDPTPIEELVRQVVASAAPHPNMPPLPYSLQKMKNAAVQLVSFNGPRSHDWSTEPGLTPLQIDALREIERLFLESRAYHKLLHGMYTTWREHRVEPRPSAGSFFKAVTPKEQQPFDDSHPLFKVFWGSHEGILSWSGEDVIPVMREIVIDLMRREAVVPPIPAEVVVVGDLVVPTVVEEGVENNLLSDGNVKAGEPNGASVEDIEIEDEAQEAEANASSGDGTGDKENQPISNQMEGTNSVKTFGESLVGTRSLPSTNLVRDAVLASMPSEESSLGSRNAISAAPLQIESNQSYKTNSVIIAGTPDNAETYIATSSEDSILTTLNPLKDIKEEHSYAKLTAHEETDDVVLADIIPVSFSYLTDMVVHHEEEVETTTSEFPAKSSSKRHGKKRSSKKKSQLDTARKQAKKTKFDEKVTGKDENCHRSSTECPTRTDLTNQDEAEGAALTNVTAGQLANGNKNLEALALSETELQAICYSGAKISQARIEEKVTADTISVLLSELIGLVVEQEETVEKLKAKKVDQGDGQEDVSSQNASAQDNATESNRIEIDEPDVIIIPEAASSNTESQEKNRSVEDQLNFGPTVRRNLSQQVTIEPDSEGKEEIKKLCKSFQYRNRKLVNEKKELLVKLENVLEIQQGTEAYQKLKRSAEKELEKSGLLDDIHLEEIHSFLLNYVCDPWYEEDSNFPRHKNVRAPCARQLFIEWDRSKNNGCPRKSSKEFSKWHKEYDKRYLIWLQLKNKVDEITKKQIKSGVITGRLEKRKMSKESKQMVQDKVTTEPPPKRRHTRRVRPSSSSVTNSSDIPEEQQCFWMVSSDC